MPCTERALTARAALSPLLLTCLLIGLPGRALAAPSVPLSVPTAALPSTALPPLRVVGTAPPWVSAPAGGFTPLPPVQAAAELYAGRADLALSSLPLPPPPAGLEPALNLPLGVFDVQVAYALPGVSLRLDLPTLCRMLAGQIHSWDDPAVRSLNPGAALPALPVLVSARSTPNGVSYALAGACVAAGAWPPSQLKSNWTSGAALTHPDPGGVRGDLNLPGVLAVFGPRELPPRTPVALLRAPDGLFVPPATAGAALPGLGRPLDAALLGSLNPRAPLPPVRTAGAYPLRGVVWAYAVREQRYRGRPQRRAELLRQLLARLWAGSGGGLAGLGSAAGSPFPGDGLRYGGQPLGADPAPLTPSAP